MIPREHRSNVSLGRSRGCRYRRSPRPPNGLSPCPWQAGRGRWGADQGGGAMAQWGTVMAVSRSSGHTMSKPTHGQIRLLAGLGVEGDAHCGKTVKHRSRVARDPTQPNLRQVHLIHGELHDELTAAGFAVSAGQMGENVTT